VRFNFDLSALARFGVMFLPEITRNKSNSQWVNDRTFTPPLRLQ